MWLERSQRGAPLAPRDAGAQSLLALTHNRLGQAEQAAEALTRARELLGQLPRSGEDLGDDWHLWVLCHLLQREADKNLKEEPPRKPATPPGGR
jgi:hypothetical protein